MITIVTFKWTPFAGYRSQYGPEHVLALRDMVARHYPHPHRFVCVTDDASGLESVETVPLWPDYAHVQNPMGRHNPSCYRRLKLFDPAIESVLGTRMICLDLDTVIVDDVTPIFQRQEPFIIWGKADYPKQWYNGSIFALTAGARPQVWSMFNPRTSPRQAKMAGKAGSDQGWISFVLGPGEATFTAADGVYSYRCDIAPVNNLLPPNARIICFHGRKDPWHYDCRDIPWVREHYYGSRRSA